EESASVTTARLTMSTIVARNSRSEKGPLVLNRKVEEPPNTMATLSAEGGPPRTRSKWRPEDEGTRRLETSCEIPPPSPALGPGGTARLPEASSACSGARRTSTRTGRLWRDSEAKTRPRGPAADPPSPHLSRGPC